MAGRAKPATAPAFPGAGRAVPDEPHFPGGLPRHLGRSRRATRISPAGMTTWRSLARGLAAGSRVMVHSVHGMGGVGKTQLAAEYAHAYARDYDLVWWIAAEEPAAIPDQFTALAARLGLTPATEPDALQAQVHDRLRTVPGWLLIFDNADATADIQPWLPPGPMPPGVPGHVIVTTRRGGFGAMGQVMDLDVIGLADAVRLLRSRVPDLGQETAEQIAAELGRLPLALEQAAAYLGHLSDARPRVPGTAAHPGRRPASGAAQSPPGRTSPSPPCGTSAWNESPASALPPCNCWTCAPTWPPSRFPWTCSLPTPICCPSPSPPRPPTSWPSRTRWPCWPTTPLPSAPTPGSSCTGSSRPPSAPATSTPVPPRKRRRRPARRDGAGRHDPLTVALAVVARGRA